MVPEAKMNVLAQCFLPDKSIYILMLLVQSSQQIKEEQRAKSNKCIYLIAMTVKYWRI